MASFVMRITNEYSRENTPTTNEAFAAGKFRLTLFYQKTVVIWVTLAQAMQNEALAATRVMQNEALAATRVVLCRVK
jgi:hypothetical protein